MIMAGFPAISTVSERQRSFILTAMCPEHLPRTQMQKKYLLSIFQLYFSFIAELKGNLNFTSC